MLIAVQLLMRLRQLMLMHGHCRQHVQAQLSSSRLRLRAFR